MQQWRRSIEEGRSVERVFSEVAARRGINMVKGSRSDDMFRHIDFWGGGEGYDVKAMKRIRRGMEQQDVLFYVELTNVNGYNGWLFGEATYIAFEMEGCFCIVDRARLTTVVKGVTTLLPLVCKPTLHRVYSRVGRKDRLVLVDMEDIKRTEPSFWNKGG